MLGYCCVWKIRSLSLNQSDQFQAGARTVSGDQLPVSQGWTCLGRGAAGAGCRCHVSSRPQAQCKPPESTQRGAAWFTDWVSLDSSTKLQSTHVLCPLTTESACGVWWGACGGRGDLLTHVFTSWVPCTEENLVSDITEKMTTRKGKAS